jgi:hypothetical protein
MTQRQLEVLLAEWQATLRLLDWTISARFVKADELDGGAIAQCRYTLERKIATIKILRPKRGPDDSPHPRDVEADLIHELLHLHAAPFEPQSWESPKGVAIEQAIDLIAEALIKLKRAGTAKRKR